MFYILAAVLIILLSTVVILHCILRRQLRQYVQSSPHSITVVLQLELHIGASESFDQEKINHNNNNNTVALVQIPQHTSFSKEFGCHLGLSHLSPSSLEKASDHDISNRPTIARPVPSYTSQSAWWTLDICVRKLFYGLEIASQFIIEISGCNLMPTPFLPIHLEFQMTKQEGQVSWIIDTCINLLGYYWSLCGDSYILFYQ